jgi:uncharacterized FAD-dependent dehydrogenase
MNETLELVLSPEIAFDNEQLCDYLSRTTGNTVSTENVALLRRSIDARSRQIKVNLKVQLFPDGVVPELISYIPDKLPFVGNAEQAIVVGAGPGGLFAALRLIELGIKPIVLERGKDVRARRRDLAAINKNNIVNPESNYCFGEGGAGTYSDGKLYTRSNKRGDIRRVLEIFVAHGANAVILADAHPHIGTNKLPAIVAALRDTIIAHGGEVHFDSKVVDFKLEGTEMKGVTLANGSQHDGIGVILATGHSARDIFELLAKKDILIEAKPFALGVRVEHQQQLIDSIQYKLPERGKYLPPSSYSLVEQVRYKGEDRGVFSFCMCPGGFIVPSATAPGELVVNGMSPSRRDGKYANSGIVVAINEPDWQGYSKHGVLAALELQSAVERKACEVSGGGQAAPAQRLMDFTFNRYSSSLLPTSYQPGLVSTQMGEVLPEFIHKRLQEGFKMFGQKMKGYLTNDAQVIGIESRTSSPVRIPRERETCEHPLTKRLFPCGEGAGYAGGIMSAAMDGERCAEALVRAYAKHSLHLATT